MKYVHESCLVKWLNQTCKMKCEVCKFDYNISYENGSLAQNISFALRSAFRDKRRLVRTLLYSLYLWIFYKRFLQMILSNLKSVKQAGKTLILTLFQLRVTKWLF
mmetsp:Transcript_6758/g.11343  ORF Transcript_6758/g.11343 Transcript_6758/m.11343 type:complete len:105 (+) Transcript_6758:616-930(+)